MAARRVSSASTANHGSTWESGDFALFSADYRLAPNSTLGSCALHCSERTLHNARLSSKVPTTTRICARRGSYDQSDRLSVRTPVLTFNPTDCVSDPRFLRSIRRIVSPIRSSWECPEFCVNAFSGFLTFVVLAFDDSGVPRVDQMGGQGRALQAEG
jgi:hypothetical protein